MYIQIILLCLLHSVFCSCQYKEANDDYHENKHLKFMSPRRYMDIDKETTDYLRSSAHSKNFSSKKFDSDVGNKTYILRNVETDLVLESKKIETNITLSVYSGENSQLWTMEHVGQGKFLFINNLAKGVLDISLERKNKDRLISFPAHGRANQYWFVESDGRIVSDLKRNNEILALTVSNDNKLYGRPINCDKNQQFVIEFA